MKVTKAYLCLIVFSLLVSLIQIGFADLKADDQTIRIKPSHIKCQIMRNLELSSYDKIILLQMLSQNLNGESEKVYSRIDVENLGCTRMPCSKPEKRMNATRCQKRQLQTLIVAASTGGRAIGISTIDPVIHLVGMHWARAYDHAKSQEDTQLWFGWGGVMRWYQ